MNYFYEMTTGEINPTEVAAAIICLKDSLVEGIEYFQSILDGSMSILILTDHSVIAARDKYGRTPIVIGEKTDGTAYCCAFESHSFINLGYHNYKELGPAEIVELTADSVTQLKKPEDQLKICSFLWVYYGYPTSTYEGVNVELMRNNCGKLLAQRDNMPKEHVDCVAGVPDSGIAHAIGYSNEAHLPYARPCIDRKSVV